MKTEYSLSDLAPIAKQILTSSPGKKLLFYGPMGAGKTTLIKELCKQLGSKDEISSPTFSLVNEYRTDDGSALFHFDFYRIEDEDEAYDIGLEDYFESDAWCFIEWPQNIENLLPLNATKIQLAILEDGRRSIQLNQLA